MNLYVFLHPKEHRHSRKLNLRHAGEHMRTGDPHLPLGIGRYHPYDSDSHGRSQSTFNFTNILLHLQGRGEMMCSRLPLIA